MSWRPYLSVDLDSTLCDTRHRYGIIEKYKSEGLPVDWGEYARACAEDAPTAFAVALRTIQRFVPWVVVSGRSASAMEATTAWLDGQQLVPEAIYLCEDDAAHTALGHAVWKAKRIAQVATERPGMIAHVDDWDELPATLDKVSNGTIPCITVLKPGYSAAKFFAGTDNPGYQTAL